MRLFMVKINDAEYTSLDNVCLAGGNEAQAQASASSILVGHLLNTNKTDGNAELFERVREADADFEPPMMFSLTTFWKPLTYIHCWLHERNVWITEMKAYIA